MLDGKKGGRVALHLGTRQAAETGKSTRCVIRNRAASLQFGLMSLAGVQRTTKVKKQNQIHITSHHITRDEKRHQAKKRRFMKIGADKDGPKRKGKKKEEKKEEGTHGARWIPGPSQIHNLIGSKPVCKHGLEGSE